jgi:hypothetical protein
MPETAPASNRAERSLFHHVLAQVDRKIKKAESAMMLAAMAIIADPTI